MSESSIEVNGGQLQDFTIDQLAGALALSLGAVGTLLLVIWQSRCACRCRLGLSDKCYIFDCSREPPPIEDKKKKNKGTNQDPRNKDPEKPEPSDQEPEPEVQP